MTQWKAYLETIIRGNVGRSVRQWSWIDRSVSTNQRAQWSIRKTRAVHADDRSPPTRDDCCLGIAHRSSDGARSRARNRSDELVIEAHYDGDAVTIVLVGEFDLTMADAVRKVLTRAIGEPRKRLVVDLSEVTFIDSSGLHVLLDAHTLCRDAEPALTIRPGPPNVQRVFELTNLLNSLPFEISG